MYVMENFFSRANLGQAFAASIIMFISVVCILAPWAYYEFYFRNKEAKV
jgi:glucose/mannose transport system permease protein